MVLLPELNVFGLLSVSSVLPFSGTNADIMKVGGYKLSALEIEAVLLEVKSYALETTTWYNKVDTPKVYAAIWTVV